MIVNILTKSNETQYKTLFKECFPNTLWKTSVPFPKDSIYTAYHDGQIIGFCMVHEEPPEKMSAPGGYIYNLCVRKAHRRKGVAADIIHAVTRDYPTCYMHMDLTDRYAANLTSLGWTKIGMKGPYYEWAIAPDLVEYCQPAYNPRQYDAVNNVIYVDC